MRFALALTSATEGFHSSKALLGVFGSMDEAFFVIVVLEVV